MNIIKIKISNIIPYILILLFNGIIASVYVSSRSVLIPTTSIILSFIIYFILSRLKNIFNKLISIFWLLFYFLGILNINAIRTQNNVWNLKIEDSSLLYLGCVLIFTLSLYFLEKTSKKRVSMKLAKEPLDYYKTVKSRFGYVILLFPIVLLIDIYRSIGYFPILSGQSFVNEMYEYNYGLLYGFKFLIVYSFCLIIIFFRKEKKILISTFYIFFLLFASSVDGKRFILLLSIFSIIPILIVERVERKRSGEVGKPLKNTPIVLGGIVVMISYVLMNILRTGGDISESISSLIENIPFGVEFKDYVHSYNTFEPGKIKNYNFELSSIGSFLNSTILEIFGFNKNELYELGSQHAWMKLYGETFGIRLGIIAELYFAYGYWVLLFMIVIAYFANFVNQKIITSTTYFKRINYSVLFGLFILLINGQATVFFGCLTMIVYIIIFFRLLSIVNVTSKRVFRLNKKEIVEHDSYRNSRF